MKRVYSISLFLLATLAVSCVREQAIVEPVAPEAETVPVVLSFQQPITLKAATKAEPGMEMGQEPAISSIHVAIFGTDRYLKDYVSAYPCDAEGNAIAGGFASQNATSAYFLARLPITSKERVLHIIANGPSSLPFNAYENDIMQSMTVTDGNGAYWQRVLLPSGITVKEVDGVREQKPNGDYIPTDATVTALSSISLIRNFASITLTENADNFEIVSYTLCNMPRSGAVAMYSTNHEDWVPNYTDPSLTLDGRLYKYMDTDDSTEKVYLGFPTNPDIDTTVPSTADAFNAPGVTVGPGEPYYVYERAVTTDNPPFILMAARYVASGTPTASTPVRYYRLDLALEDGYFPIYRNFNYTVNVSGVSVEGYDTPAEASLHNSGTNFSISLDTRSLPEVSNGIVRLFVEHANYDWVYNTDEQNFGFRFTLNGASGTLNDDVTVTHKEGNAINSLTVDSTDDSGEFRRVRYKLNMPDGTSTLTSTIQLEGTYTDGLGATYRLVRMVTIRVFNAKQINPYFTPFAVANEAAQLTILNIPLPWDLQSSMFPMEILIEDDGKVLNPASSESMPVKTTGVTDPDEPFTSLTGSGSTSYCFVRTLNWSEYQRLKNNAELSGSSDIVLTCEFETTKAFTSTTAYVYNKYFATNASGVTTAQAKLTGDPDNNITPNRQTFSGTTTHITVKSDGDWVLKIALLNGNVAAGASLSPDSGTATTGTDVLVTLPENVTENAIRYRVTLTNTTSSLTRTALMTQEGIAMSLTSSVTNVDNSQNALTVSVQSGSKYILEVFDQNSNLISATGENAPTLAAVNHQVIIPQNNTFSERQFTIRLRNVIGTVWKDLTITQEAAVAQLSVYDSEISMQAPTAMVTTLNSFPVKLKVFNNATDELVYTSDELAKATSPVQRSVTVGAHTGAAITYRVEMWRADLSEQLGDAITFVQKPTISLAAASTSVKGNEDATISVFADFDWVLTSPDGATFSVSSGSATSGTPVSVNVTMPVNYETTSKTFTLTAQGTGENASLSKSITITQRAVTLRTGQTVTFNTTSGATAAYRYSTSNRSVSQNGITGAFSAISAVGGTYMTLTNGTTFTLSTDNTKVKEITRVVLTFNSNNRRPQNTYSSVTAGTVSWGTTTTWTGNESSFSITMSRQNNDLQLRQYVVTYTDYQWN
ncbi:MAG: hypothetical protein IJ623_05305 [Bacteroidales bacterium]|nr:hypothetical protein [Bacteroidales bacterium]